MFSDFTKHDVDVGDGQIIHCVKGGSGPALPCCCCMATRRPTSSGTKWPRAWPNGIP